MRIPFVKMHGCANDYVFVDDGLAREPVPGARFGPGTARRIADRHRGVGGDGLILLRRGETEAVRMTMYNADGSEGLLCLNGLRCAAKYAADRVPGLGPEFGMETASGVRRVRVTASSPAHSTVRVEVGRPEFRRGHIPAAGEGAELWDEPVEVSGRTFPGYGLSLGNPHLVLWFDAVESLLAHPIREFHPLSVNTALFPEGVNVHGALRAGPDELRMRTWERGSGETQACGSGSVAVFAVARRLGLVGGRATVHMPGGPVVMEENPDGLLVMTGPAEEVFSGVWEAGEG